MLITVFLHFQPEDHHQEPCNEIGCRSLAEPLLEFEPGNLLIRLVNLDGQANFYDSQYMALGEIRGESSHTSQKFTPSSPTRKNCHPSRLPKEILFPLHPKVYFPTK